MFRPRPASQQTQQSSTSSDASLHTSSAMPEAGPSTLPPPPPAPTSTGQPEPESFISRMMADNPYFSAGAGLMGIGVVLTIVRRSVTLGSTFAQRRMLVTLEIPSKDRAYPWFLEWMAARAPQPGPVAFSSSSLSSIASPSSVAAASSSSVAAASPSSVATAPSVPSWWKGKSVALRSHELAVETTYKQHENGSSEAVFNLVPGPGTHYFKYKGAWFQVKRERDAKLMDLHSGSPWETLTLTTLSSCRHLFPVLLSEARTLAEKSTEGKTVVYTAWGVEWRPFGKPRRKRELPSVVLAQDVSERIEHDLRGFLGRGKWYAERGIPYRRGYLLHGPPGSGKTSFIQALAGALSYNICLLNLSERGLTDDKLNHLLGLVPERSFVLLEDIDSAFNRRAQTSEDGFKGSVTFSGLLNALDGVASSEERVIFMTTNHFGKLDPALIRPGRVDVQELLDDAAGEQAQRLFVKFYGGSESVEATLGETEVKELGERVSRIVDEQKARGRYVSMASLQGLFIRTSAREAVEGVEALCRARA